MYEFSLFSFFIVLLASPYFDHNAFTHHAQHVLNSPAPDNNSQRTLLHRAETK